MPDSQPSPAGTHRVLVKLLPSNALRAADSSAVLQPLYDTPQGVAGGFGFDSTPQWFVAELPGEGAKPWDLAHASIAGQLGLAEPDVVFAEPDMIHQVYQDTNERP